MQDVAGAALLHGDRAHPGVQCAAIECGRDRIPELLTGHVVEIGLEHEGGLAWADGDVLGPSPDHDLGAVRQVVHLPGSPAEAGPGDRHVGERSERRRERREESGPRRRRQLQGDVPTVGGDAFEEADGGRGRVGQPPVCTVHGAAARGHGRGAHLVDPEHLQCGCGADDVDDGVVPTDLVEVHLVDRAPVQV